MRVLQLGLGEGRTIDLHPGISVVAGLSAGERTALRRGFSSIATGLAPEQPGLVEAHGLLLDASQDDLDLLEVPTTPVLAVATVAEVADDLPAEVVEPVRAAGRDLLLLAGDRWQRAEAARRLEPAMPARPPDEARVALLRGRIARHAARDAEGVRTALDDVRDRARAGRAPDPGPLATALAAVGLDATDLGLSVEELARIAEDWLDERRREADWVVGAEVELAALERFHEEGPAEGETGAEASADDAARATRTHALAVVRFDEHQMAVSEAHPVAPDAAAVVAHLLGRLGTHRPARLAGAVPLVLHDVLTHLGSDDVAHVLERAAGLAGAVQLVVVDDNPAARTWATEAGIRRAAAVEPVPDGAIGPPA